MANRLKEDEKNERIIRGLCKLADNRRCMNCNSLGPQYVCTNFWTFVCTTCSGIHREFTHRVKSISMAKFTSQEVSALQEGGNQRAKEIYFKEWDPQRQSVPDSSNVERLRDFIKHVYVDKRYTGERNHDKPPRVKMGDKEDSYQGGSRSPPYEDTYDRRYSERSSPGGRSDDKNYKYGYDERRSPGYEQESRQHGDYRRSSPARPEIVNDWRREERFGNGRKVEDRRISDGDLKLEGRSPERTRDVESSSPPMVRPVREILGENVMPLRISEPPKANGGRVADSSVHTQRTASSSSLGSTNENPAEVKLESTRSLIDFDADPEPPRTAAVTQTQQTTIVQSLVQPTTSTNDNNWASFDFAPEVKASQAPSSFDTLESVFSQLSVPASVSGQVSGIPSGTGAPVASVASAFPGSGNSPVASVGGTPFSPFSTAAPSAAPVSSFATFPPVNALAAGPGWTQVFPANGGNSFTMQHQQPPLFPTGSQSNAPQFTPPVGGASNNQPWNLSLAQNAQGPLSTPAAQAPTPFPKPAVEVPYGAVSQPPPVEVKSSGRTELPQDLFAATYSSFPAPVPGWQSGQPRGMGFMQYNTAVPMPTLVQSHSTNPFDFNSESPPVQAQTFPSMASLQGALPNASPPSGLMRTPSLGTPTPAWMPPQPSSYPSAMPLQTPIYASTLPPRAYMGPQVPSNMPPTGYQGVGGFGGERPAYGFMNPDQQLAGRFSAPAAPHPSVGGNPFGK
ncbi:hypothetical protein Dsin_015471 [Dipteronia sinensis]|uniref:Arf-GAP domain-containing protein n=1 Tax=Dipteronia sinensis TaxID=43782 RepID=A0AAE0ABC1_9ROSI|nr:hypothetical protein Dsin_015471 [Dipteronia sinensis]